MSIFGVISSANRVLRAVAAKKRAEARLADAHAAASSVGSAVTIVDSAINVFEAFARQEHREKAGKHASKLDHVLAELAPMVGQFFAVMIEKESKGSAAQVEQVGSPASSSCADHGCAGVSSLEDLFVNEAVLPDLPEFRAYLAGYRVGVSGDNLSSPPDGFLSDEINAWHVGYQLGQKARAIVNATRGGASSPASSGASSPASPAPSDS